MPKTKIRFTLEDYQNLPESETKRYELLDGELVMVPSPTEEHQRLSRHLQFALWGHVKEHDLGEVYYAPFDVVLGKAGEEDVVQPDILYVSKERRRIITKANIRGVPDLVVEILSPATGQRDRTYKKRLYARHGVREFWIVDPEEQKVEVFSLTEAGYRSVGVYADEDTLTSRLLTGLRIPIKEIFACVMSEGDRYAHR